MIGLKGLVAAVVGGVGSIGGALLGGLAVGAFEAFWSAYLPIEQRDLAVLVISWRSLSCDPARIIWLERAGAERLSSAASFEAVLWRALRLSYLPEHGKR